MSTDVFPPFSEYRSSGNSKDIGYPLPFYGGGQEQYGLYFDGVNSNLRFPEIKAVPNDGFMEIGLVLLAGSYITAQGSNNWVRQIVGDISTEINGTLTNYGVSIPFSTYIELRFQRDGTNIDLIKNGVNEGTFTTSSAIWNLLFTASRNASNDFSELILVYQNVNGFLVNYDNNWNGSTNNGGVLYKSSDNWQTWGPA